VIASNVILFVYVISLSQHGPMRVATGQWVY